MTCLICLQADIVDGHIAVTFQRGEMSVVVKNVPARVCPQCGEAFLNEDVTEQLLLDAEKVSAIGVVEAEIEFSQLVGTRWAT